MTVDAAKIACRICEIMGNMATSHEYGITCKDTGGDFHQLANYLLAAESSCDLDETLECLVINYQEDYSSDYEAETTTDSTSCTITITNVTPTNQCSDVIIIVTSS